MTIQYREPGETTKGRGGLRKNWERMEPPELSPRMEALVALMERPKHHE